MNTYQFYVSLATNAPVLFHFTGYDQLYGSHYDEYKIDYLSFSAVIKDSSVFDTPAMMCEANLPGPGLYTRHYARGALSCLEDSSEVFLYLMFFYLLDCGRVCV